jgi:short-subunit dehydrogenase
MYVENAMEFTGQTALITGASTGIGATFARDLAARGANLVLVARSEDRLRALAAELVQEHGVRVDVLALDLGAPGVGADVQARVEALGLEVDVLVNNAGFGTHGDLVHADLTRLLAEVQLNCATVVDLTTRFLPAMTGRRRGVVVNVASTAGFQPVPHMAVYAATKAFVLSFTEAVWAESKDSGVAVLALCPGATRTPFFDVVGTDDVVVGTLRTPEQVVATALRGLARRRPSIVDGWVNGVVARTAGLLPRRAVIGIAERTVRPSNRTPARAAGPTRAAGSR